MAMRSRCGDPRLCGTFGMWRQWSYLACDKKLLDPFSHRRHCTFYPSKRHLVEPIVRVQRVKLSDLLDHHVAVDIVVVIECL